jgi:hypothetical protein
MRAPSSSDRPDELFDPLAIGDPHPLHARLRATHPLFRVAETGVHGVVSWDGIEEVLGRESGGSGASARSLTLDGREDGVIENREMRRLAERYRAARP